MSNVGVVNDNYFAFNDNLRRQLQALSNIPYKIMTDSINQQLKALSNIPYKTMTDNINRQLKALSDIPYKAMTDSINRQLKALTDIPYKTMTDSINRQLKALTDIPYKTMTDNINQQLKALTNIPLKSMTDNLNCQLQEITKIIDKTFTDDNFNNLLKDVLENNNYYSDSFGNTYSMDSVNSDEVMEVSNDLNSIVSDSLNWQQKFACTLVKWKEKNPVIAFLLNNIILVIILGIISSYFYSAITSKKSSIKFQPKYGSQIIYKIDTNKEVTVISDVPYYCEIKFLDESDGQTKTGWISKRSIKVIEDSTSEGNAE